MMTKKTRTERLSDNAKQLRKAKRVKDAKGLVNIDDLPVGKFEDDIMVKFGRGHNTTHTYSALSFPLLCFTNSNLEILMDFPDAHCVCVGWEQTKQPACVCKGTMRHYQIDGLNWLISRHDNAVGGILGDEMGLGKTPYRPSPSWAI